MGCAKDGSNIACEWLEQVSFWNRQVAKRNKLAVADVSLHMWFGEFALVWLLSSLIINAFRRPVMFLCLSSYVPTFDAAAKSAKVCYCLALCFVKLSQV